jgi:hypothetical protein
MENGESMKQFLTRRSPPAIFADDVITICLGVMATLGQRPSGGWHCIFWS